METLAGGVAAQDAHTMLLHHIDVDRLVGKQQGDIDLRLIALGLDGGVGILYVVVTLDQRLCSCAADGEACQHVGRALQSLIPNSTLYEVRAFVER